jgi:hypothetical protein
MLQSPVTGEGPRAARGRSDAPDGYNSAARAQAVLLVISSGYCITRSDLGPHKQHVIFVPTVVLVTGLVSSRRFADTVGASDPQR